jgi:hypothetical protein
MFPKSYPIPEIGCHGYPFVVGTTGSGFVVIIIIIIIIIAAIGEDVCRRLDDAYS